MTWRALVPLLLLGCPGQAVPPAVLPQRVALADQPARFVIRGRTIGSIPNTDVRAGVWAVVVDGTGRPAWVLVTFLTGPTQRFASGDLITAWCQVAEGDTVADSVRVEPGP